jgi:ubiquinone/menaquinone biosynthesis C-methylase UbiE
MDTEMISPIMPSYNTMELDELPFWSAAFGLELLSKMVYKPKLRVLDIGCGTGFPLLEVAMRLGKDALVYGLDPNALALKRANAKAQLMCVSSIRLLESFAESIPLPDNSIDSIISNNGFNNVTDIAMVFDECKRVLLPNGQLLFTYNTSKTMELFYKVFEEVLAELDLGASIRLMHNHILKKRPPEQHIISLLTSKGFVIDSIDYRQFSYQFASGSAFFDHGFILSAFYPSWHQLVPSAMVTAVFGSIKERLNQWADENTGINMPVPFVVINCRYKG